MWHQVCRTTLLPSALKTLAANKGEPLPLRLFELSDVVLLDSSRDVGARNERRLLAVTCGKTSEFDVVHGLLNRVMQVLGIPYIGGWVPPTPVVCVCGGGGEIGEGGCKFGVANLALLNVVFVWRVWPAEPGDAGAGHPIQTWAHSNESV